MPDHGDVFVLETHAQVAVFAGARVVRANHLASRRLCSHKSAEQDGVRLQLPGIDLQVPAHAAAAMSMHRAMRLDEACAGELRQIMSKMDNVHAQVWNPIISEINVNCDDESYFMGVCSKY